MMPQTKRAGRLRLGVEGRLLAQLVGTGERRLVPTVGKSPDQTFVDLLGPNNTYDWGWRRMQRSCVPHSENSPLR